MTRIRQFINQNKWDSFLLVIVTCFSLFYLIAIPFGWIHTRFELTEIIILAIILLINSELLERLRKLGITKDGITFELDQIQAEQKSQRDNIETNKANIEAATNVLQRLTWLESQIAERSKDQVLSHNLLNEYELKHLRKLASDTPFNYKRQPSFERELRYLRALGFVENIPGKTISQMPERGNLKEYIRITEQGKHYLEKIETTSDAMNYSSLPNHNGSEAASENSNTL
jgi:DNA-binding transcriptional regulator YhcF (GntR family)